MRKKIFVLSVVLLCVLGFSACGKKAASKGIQNEITGWAKDVELYKEETAEELYEKAKKEGFSSILDEWRILSSTLGKTVEVTLPRETLIGRAVDIDGDGNLLVMSEKGMERVVAGDVRVRTK